MVSPTAVLLMMHVALVAVMVHRVPVVMVSPTAARSRMIAVFAIEMAFHVLHALANPNGHSMA
jgi:hypothetical protein